MRPTWAIALALFAPAVGLAGGSSPPFFARVVAVTPANSLLVQTSAEPARQVVLAFVSIPMGQQPYADHAHAVLTDNLVGQRVSIRPVGVPEAEYTLGLVYHGTSNVNLAMVEQGHAWADYFQLNHPQWNRAQQRARSAGLGLHADADAIHPRRWQEQLQQARIVVGAMQHMSSHSIMGDVMQSTFVAHRVEMVFVPLSCIQVWGLWPRSVRAPVTTVAGAEFRGYTPAPCPPAGNPSADQ